MERLSWGWKILVEIGKLASKNSFLEGASQSIGVPLCRDSPAGKTPRNKANVCEHCCASGCIGGIAQINNNDACS